MGQRADQFVVLPSPLCWVAVAGAALPLLLLTVSSNGLVAAEGECGKVRCGMGTCAESGDYAFGFACQCNPGWSRYHLGSLQFPFLPCVIPNCTINYNCKDDGPSSPPPAPSPPPPPPLQTNFSIFDPCLMQYCGGDGGACEKASDFTHRCRCRDGYANLLNDTSYPCYRQCSLGSDCKDLGINVINGSTPSTSPPAPFSFTVKKSGAGATAAPAGRLLELVLLMSFLWLQAI